MNIIFESNIKFLVFLSQHTLYITMPHKHAPKHHKKPQVSIAPAPAPMMINQLSEMQPFENSVGAIPIKMQPMAPQYNPAPEAAPSANADFADY